MNYYNEIDKFAAAWLRELIADGLIPAGDVDERSIVDVQGDDVRGYAQCHWFAGIAGWPLALSLASWPEDQPVWTGSCPCQPFSVAGKAGGLGDERHLWPAFQRLITECRPATVFGEQVASADGREWLTGVRIDLEALGYAVGAADLCAAGVGAPHIRQRLYWMAYAGSSGCGRTQEQTRSASYRFSERGGSGAINNSRGVEHPTGERCFRSVGATHARSNGRDYQIPTERTSGDGFWSDSILIPCRDGKARRVPAESALFPLASGIPNRVGTLRGAGNAICPPLAAEFVTAALEAL